MFEAFLRFFAMASLGVLAAIAYYRGGPWWGSLVSLMTVGAPAVAVIYLFGERGAWIAPTTRAALAVVVIAVVTLAYSALIRGATIRGKESLIAATSGVTTGAGGHAHRRPTSPT
ncbi:MAG: hypothetical protein U5J97_10190 [Trueperaceae bacterium]|nr:hypothetical protein [Trueperaceae bacterium]